MRQNPRGTPKIDYADLVTTNVEKCSVAGTSPKSLRLRRRRNGGAHAALLNFWLSTVETAKHITATIGAGPIHRVGTMARWRKDDPSLSSPSSEEVGTLRLGDAEMRTRPD